MLRCDLLVFYSCDWCISILVVPVYRCSLSGRLSYCSPVLFCFFKVAVVVVVVVRMKPYLNRFFDPACVPARITINRLVVSSVVGAL